MAKKDIKIAHRSNYIVYIDDVRVDQFLVNWQSSIGLSANQASASLTFFRSPAMDEWKAYLSKVKIFAENPFTKKFSMVFEGDIISRSYSESKKHMGTITFHCSGFYHWLEVKIPMAISTTDEMNPLQRFIYEAQNINIEEVRAFVTSDAEILMKDNNVQGVIDQLFEKVTIGYYQAAEDNTNFAFSKIKDRFVILSDVKEEFRESGFLDLFTFSKATYIDSFSAYLVEVIEQLMMEFYQDRDGTMKIKFPAWGDDVLKSHILDASIIESISGVDNWAIEPTRVLAVGSATHLQKALQANSVGGNMMYDLTIPVGLYIGNPRDPDTEDYYATSFQYQNAGGGELGDNSGGLSGSADYAEFAGEDAVRGKAISTGEWFDNLANYRVTSGHHSVNPSRPKHMGTDYGTKYETLYNIGTHGTVVDNAGPHKTMGWHLTIGQDIDGVYHEFKYMHLNKQSPLKIGQKVTPGQVIGQSGATGGAVTANLGGKKMSAHLHLEVWEGKWYKGKNLNPEGFLSYHRRKRAGENVVVPGASGGTTTAGTGEVAAPAASGNRYVDANTVKNFNRKGAFNYTSLPKEADEIVTVNNNVSEATLNAMLKGGLANTAKHYIEMGNKYGIDPAFGVSISTMETGHGKYTSHNNIAGMMDPKTNWQTKIRFATIRDGIEAFFSNLKRNYIDVGLITPRLIQAKYTPAGAKNDPNNTNSHWLPSVLKFWLQLRGREATISTDFTPYASTSGSGSGIGLVNYSSTMTRVTDKVNRARVESFGKVKVEVPMTYTDSLQADKIPAIGMLYTSELSKQTGKVAPKMLASIINVKTNWNPRYEKSNEIGIMATNKKLLTDKEIPAMRNYAFAIQKAAYLINYAKGMYFGGKIVPAVAAYLHGDLLDISKRLRAEGGDFYKLVKKDGGLQYMKDLRRVMDDFLGEYDYLPGQMHKDMTGKYIQVNGSVMKVKEDGSFEAFSEENFTDFIEDAEEIEEAFQAKLSDEERMYKINLVQVEQELIRMDSPAIGANNSSGSDMDGGFPSDGAVTIGPELPIEGQELNLNKNKEKGKEQKPPGPVNKKPSPVVDSLKEGVNNPLKNPYKDVYPNILDSVKGAGGKSLLGNTMMMSASFENIAPRSTMQLSSPTARMMRMASEPEPQPVTDPTSAIKNFNLETSIHAGEGTSTSMILKDIIQEAKFENVADYAAEIDELIYQYAKYNMQLHRAMAHDVQVRLTLCLPQLRVGFNMWLEPTRTDVVFYATSINHSGSFGSGCRTDVSGGFVRSTKDYKDVSENVFIGERHADSSSFGETVPPSGLQTIRNELKSLHERGVSEEAHKITTLAKLYGSQTKDNKYSTKWNSEKTVEEIENMVKEEYASAPEVIQEKKKQTREAIDKSVEIFVELLHATFLGGK